MIVVTFAAIIFFCSRISYRAARIQNDIDRFNSIEQQYREYEHDDYDWISTFQGVREKYSNGELDAEYLRALDARIDWHRRCMSINKSVADKAGQLRRILSKAKWRFWQEQPLASKSLNIPPEYPAQPPPPRTESPEVELIPEVAEPSQH